MQICGLDNTLRKPCSLKLHCTKCRTFFFSKSVLFHRAEGVLIFNTGEKLTAYFMRYGKNY